MAHWLNQQDRDRLEAAIRAAEFETSGEIVVALKAHVKGDIYHTAKTFFDQHKLTRTADRNGVLLLLAYKDRRIALLGDEGINNRVPPDFWEGTVAKMTARFREQDYIGGLEVGIRDIGQQLKRFFPHREDDVNELPDDIMDEDAETEHGTV